MDTNPPPIAVLRVELRALAGLPVADATRRMVAANNVLALPSADLLALLRQEARANPALDVVAHRLARREPRTVGAGPARQPAPEVIIAREAGTASQRGFTVQVVESTRFQVRLCLGEPRRHQAARGPGAALAADGRQAGQQDRRDVARARLMVALVHERWRTLARLTECLIALQWDALLRGDDCLFPLARGPAAFRAGLHEATLCRAITGKCVQLPTGMVVPFSRFFRADPTVARALRQIVNAEPFPLTDEELATALRRRHIAVVPDLVAAYRDELGIRAPELRGPRRPLPVATPPATREEPRTPAARARELLYALLDEREREQLTKSGYLDVPSPGHAHRFYRIPRHVGRVRMFEGGAPVADLCVVPTRALPRADVVLMHKLLIQGDEEAYLRSANHFPVWVPRPYVAPAPPAALAQWGGAPGPINP
ncbi:MAG TPA: hypothetical protein VGR57_09175, partial [Ktedonobacterales bacterium]|nr:hypothetical protein [Ktedonobacterales bacterium]